MAKDSKKEQPEKNAQKWEKRFNKCEDNQRDLFERAAKNYDIMYAVQNTKNMAPWRSKVYVPILASKAWDLISRFSDVIPVFNVDIKGETEIEQKEDGSEEISYTAEANEGVEKIERLMQDEYQNASGEPMPLRVFDTLLDAVVAGTGFAKTPWAYEQRKNYAREFDEKGQIKNDAEEIVKTVESGHNDFVPINFYNMFIAPGAQSFFKAPYWIVREYTTLQEAEDSGLYDKEALKKLRTDISRSKTFDTYNKSRNRLVNDGSNTQDDTVDNIVLYECCDLQGDYFVFGEGENIDGWVELLHEEKKYWHGRPPYVPFYIRKKSFSPWGESLFENNSKLQAATNDLFNHYLDNWNLSIDQMLIYEDGALQNEFIVQPGGEVIYSGTKPEQFKFGDPNPNQLSTVLDVINQAIEAATVPQYLSGVPNSQLDNTAGTATGINLITEAATEKVGFMRKNIKQSMRVVGQNWLSNLQQFLDENKEIPVFKGGVKKPMIITPGDLQREIELDIDDDSMVPISDQQRRETTTAYTAQLLSLQQAAVAQSQIFNTPQDVPRYNFNEMIEDVSMAYSVKDFTKYLQTNPMSQQGAAAPGMPPGVAPPPAGNSGLEQEQAAVQGA